MSRAHFNLNVDSTHLNVPEILIIIKKKFKAILSFLIFIILTNKFQVLILSQQITHSMYSVFSNNGLIKQLTAPVKHYRAHFCTFFKTLKLWQESKEEENVRWWRRTAEGRMSVAVGFGNERGRKGELWQIFDLKAKAKRGTHRFSGEQPCPPQFQEGPLCPDPLFSNKHN